MTEKEYEIYCMYKCNHDLQITSELFGGMDQNEIKNIIEKGLVEQKSKDDYYRTFLEKHNARK